MRAAQLFFLLLFSTSAFAKDSAALFQEWEKIKTPLPGPAQAIGFYSAGCLQGAQKLEKDEVGFSMMRLTRNRYYAHPNMIAFLKTLGAKLKNQKMPTLLIGDVSPPRGGPMRTGHSSHQVGLDADLWLTMLSRRPTNRERETMKAPSYVLNGKKLKKMWGPTQIQLVTAVAEMDGINRIFISPVMKKFFCEKFPNAPWLYKLRPWWDHEDHIHVRLNCPTAPDSPLCKVQEPVDSKDPDCKIDLDQWKEEKVPTEREFPTLPNECEMMVKTTEMPTQ